MLKLFFLNSPRKGKSIEFDGNVAYVGRLADNDIQIKDKTVSRRHLRISRDGNKFIIKDLRSKNGTFLKGKLLMPDLDYEIDPGVPFAIGKIVMSLGNRYADDIFTREEMLDLTDGFSSTAMFTALKDRPLTQPKNMDFFYKVSNVLNESLNINELMQKVLDYIFELFKRIDRGFIILIDSKTKEIKNVISRYSKDNNVDSIPREYSKMIVNGVITSGKTITILDTFGQDDANLSDSMEIMRVKSVMCVPLISRSKIRGVIYVDSVKIPYGFREEDLALILALSNPAAIAIENALLYQNLEKKVEERTESLKNTEKLLSESEKRFRAMFNNMSSGVIILKVENGGKDFLILDLNRSEYRTERINKKDAMGRQLFDALPDLKKTGLMEALKRVYKTGKAERLTVEIVRNNTQSNWRDYYIYTLPNDEIVAVFDDITEKKKAEVVQKRLQQQLFASQKLETIGAFAGGTAHNFRNILQAISGNVEYLETVYSNDPEVTGISKNIYSSIDKGVGLINNLLHFSRKNLRVEMEGLDLAEVIRKTHEIIEKVFNKKIEIILDLQEGLILRGNLSLLSQAFMNLFTNARDAMPNGGKLTIKARRDKNGITAIVADTGHGIDPAVIDKIFDPFFTLKDVGSGTGLGLSTTHGIIEQHHGKITVSSRPGSGTVFKLMFPFADGEQTTAVQSSYEIIFGKGQKILLIDDEQPVLDSMTSLLEKLEYNVFAVNDSSKAVDSANVLDPDLILIDRNMPAPDGITCINNILKERPYQKIIIVSGYDEVGPDGIAPEIRKMIKGYLTKPCGMIDLSRSIYGALEE